jgi:hypothetical protein
VQRLCAAFLLAIAPSCSSSTDEDTATATHEAACDDLNRVLRDNCHMIDDEHGNPGTHDEAQRDDGSCDPGIAHCLLNALSGRELTQPDDCHQVIHLGDGARCGSARN